MYKRGGRYICASRQPIISPHQKLTISSKCRGCGEICVGRCNNINRGIIAADRLSLIQNRIIISADTSNIIFIAVVGSPIPDNSTIGCNIILGRALVQCYTILQSKVTVDPLELCRSDDSIVNHQFSNFSVIKTKPVSDAHTTIAPGK